VLCVANESSEAEVPDVDNAVVETFWGNDGPVDEATDEAKEEADTDVDGPRNEADVDESPVAGSTVLARVPFKLAVDGARVDCTGKVLSELLAVVTWGSTLAVAIEDTPVGNSVNVKFKGGVIAGITVGIGSTEFKGTSAEVKGSEVVILSTMPVADASSLVTEATKFVADTTSDVSAEISLDTNGRTLVAGIDSEDIRVGNDELTKAVNDWTIVGTLIDVGLTGSSEVNALPNTLVADPTSEVTEPTKPVAADPTSEVTEPSKEVKAGIISVSKPEGRGNEGVDERRDKPDSLADWEVDTVKLEREDPLELETSELLLLKLVDRVVVVTIVDVHVDVELAVIVTMFGENLSPQVVIDDVPMSMPTPRLWFVPLPPDNWNLSRGGMSRWWAEASFSPSSNLNLGESSWSKNSRVLSLPFLEWW
jgi:hypothetical protein